MVKKDYQLRKEVEAFGPYPAILQKLLFHRGISREDLAESFLKPEYGHLHDPYLMKDMDKAVERIFKAISNDEKIVVYSDYDADGIPGGVMMKEFFDKIGYKSATNYIPHRHDEGFGLNVDAINEFKNDGVTLVITLDCGIADVEAVKLANKLRISVIITDHHEPGAILPEAFAILDPKQANCNYPDKNLCGTAVAFKLIQGILGKDRFGLKVGHEKWFLDLVGIATLSDMVPLVGENRVFAYYGLMVLQKSRRPGLSRLWWKLGVSQQFISEDDIGFTLAPRINAASRMGEPMDAFKLLATLDRTEADEAADHLNRINDERKGVVASMVKDIKKHLRERRDNGTLQPIIVIGNPEWKPSLLGLAANSVVEEFNRPVFLWGRNGDNTLKGSCRSAQGVNLVKLMESSKDSFIQFGGHKMAGGFAITNEKVHTLESDLNKFSDVIKDEDEINWFDALLLLDDLESTHQQVLRLAPFGVGNEKPLFMLEGVTPSSVKQFGKEKNHLELTFLDKEGKEVRAISFFVKPESFTNVPEIDKKVNLLATIEKSTFRNKTELRLRIVDII
jgi:single-stranded-DNA-specific exonuclease